MKMKEPARFYREFSFEIKPELRQILFLIDDYTRIAHGKEITITSLVRTPEENTNLGGMQYSAHLFGRAADIRSHNFSPAELQDIISYMNGRWPDLYVIYHSALTGPHIHINLKYEG
jgi:uncharacterized protein YcbK (DUF882 family)